MLDIYLTTTTRKAGTTPLLLSHEHYKLEKIEYNIILSAETDKKFTCLCDALTDVDLRDKSQRASEHPAGNGKFFNIAIKVLIVALYFVCYIQCYQPTLTIDGIQLSLKQ